MAGYIGTNHLGLNDGVIGEGVGQVFQEFSKSVETDTTLRGDKNYLTVGPYEVGDGVTLTIEDGSVLVVV